MSFSRNSSNGRYTNDTYYLRDLLDRSTFFTHKVRSPWAVPRTPLNTYSSYSYPYPYPYPHTQLSKLETAVRRKSNRRRARLHISAPRPAASGAFPLVPSACFPPSARSRVALPLALRVSALTPLTPSLATPPSSACSRSSRACSSCYRVFLRSVVLPRCCCAALSHRILLATPHLMRQTCYPPNTLHWHGIY